jgi:hypothetical protein
MDQKTFALRPFKDLALGGSGEEEPVSASSQYAHFREDTDFLAAPAEGAFGMGDDQGAGHSPFSPGRGRDAKPGYFYACDDGRERYSAGLWPKR